MVELHEGTCARGHARPATAMPPYLWTPLGGLGFGKDVLGLEAWLAGRAADAEGQEQEGPQEAESRCGTLELHSGKVSSEEDDGSVLGVA